MNGKTIRLYLVDGIPNGILTAEIINWTGKVIVAPRSRLAELRKRDEAGRTGVYLLVGADPESTTRDRVYVGEGDNVFTRIKKHDGDDTKDFFTRVILITSKDENLTKSHVRYLESRLIQICNAAKRATVANGTAHSPPPMPEPDIADMEFFLGQVQMILPVLGHTFLQSTPRVSDNAVGASEPASPVFEIQVAGAIGKAVQIGDEFVVLKGSTARKHGVDSWTSFKKLREQLVSDGRIVHGDDPENYVFAEDIAFSSPSAGAAAVAGRNINGRVNWKLPDGRTYADWQDAESSAADCGIEPVEDLQ